MLNVSGLCTDYVGERGQVIRAAQDVKPAIDEGVAVLKSGGVCLIDLHIDPGQERTAHSSVGRRNL